MKITRMLPFLEKEELAELLESLIKGELKEENVSMAALLPFLESDQIAHLFERAVAGEVKLRPVAILPFMDERDYDAIIDKLIETDVETISLDEMLPFLTEAQIKKVFRLYLEKEKQKQ